MATLAESGGRVRFEESHKGSLLNIHVVSDDGETKMYSVPHTGLRVNDGDLIEKGTALNDGALNPHDVLRTASRAWISTTSTLKSLSVR